MYSRKTQQHDGDAVVVQIAANFLIQLNKVYRCGQGGTAFPPSHPQEEHGQAMHISSHPAKQAAKNYYDKQIEVTTSSKQLFWSLMKLYRDGNYTIIAG